MWAQFASAKIYLSVQQSNVFITMENIVYER